ncbi:ABC transporter permease [Lysinibacillus fusiformis]|uniref:ABC transporter permease n=1 Tax=Lysinibacillus fusiformis TaxID=28031 RepID=UPI0023AA0BCF|nr:ABC transporter permease [Lysinibacillus fusiformis]WEA37342.1 ABC transporter permease subunit [Lysinibacillus fusiformis]
MIAIWKKEFIQSFRSIFSLITIGIFIAVSYYLSDFVTNSSLLTGIKFAEAGYVSGLVFLIYIMGFLFIFSLFHDTINRETESRTIRFLVTKTSRSSIIVGKVLGIFSYWFICLLASFSIIAFFSHEFYIKTFGSLFVMLAYIVSLCVLLSCLIPKRSMSMFIGLLISMAIPTFGLWSLFSEKLWLKIIKYMTPYHYMLEGGTWGWLVVLLFAAIMVGVSILSLHRRDL